MVRPLTNLPAGTNHILAEATDSAGNRLTAISSFFFKVPLPISIPVPAGTGSGTTFGITNGQLLDVGRIYALSSKPDPTNFFVGWLSDASYIDFNSTHRFFMETNKLVYAQFDTNRFPNVKGNYNGLFVNTTNAEQRSSGFFSLTLSDSGSYSAKLIVNGYSYPFSSRFSTDGTSPYADFFGPGLPGRTTIRMNVDVANPDNQLRGSVSNFYAYLIPTLTTNFIVITNVTSTSTNVVIVATNVIMQIPTTNTWSAELIADRVVFNSKLNPAPQAGKYTVIIPAETNSPLATATEPSLSRAPAASRLPVCWPTARRPRRRPSSPRTGTGLSMSRSTRRTARWSVGSTSPMKR